MGNKFRALLILLLVVAAIYTVVPSPIKRDFKFGGKTYKIDWTRPSLFGRDLNLKLGLDLSGGVQIILRADTQKMSAEDRKTALASLREVIARRVDLFGVSEPNVYTLSSDNGDKIVLELPGVTDPQKALDLVGKTALLEFRKPLIVQGKTASDAATIAGFVPSDLTGKDLKKAAVGFDQSTGKPVVSLEFTNEGKDKFAALTKEFLNQPIAIYLDNNLLTAPVVQTEITTGQAQITGNYSTDDAQKLAIQLNAGALPVPVSVDNQKNIPPTLGQDSVTHSIRAGVVGLGIVIAFMILYYGYMGFIASIGLLIYGLLTIALYKLIPVTLSLPGIAGLLLSIGMAVDSNILIFERYKEEIRAGKPWQLALELGFGRAWDSIKDANFTTLITSFILFNPLGWSFLPTAGPVRGFAMTLALGVAVSLFTGIVVTRTFLRMFYHGPRKSVIKAVKHD